MKSVACFSSSVRAACSAPLPLSRGLNLRSPVSRCSDAQRPCAAGVRAIHGAQVTPAAVQRASAAPPPGPVPVPLRTEDDLNVDQWGVAPKAAARPAHLSPRVPYAKPQSHAAAPVSIQTVIEGLASLCGAVQGAAASPGEAARVYSLLALCHDPASPRQRLTLATLHRRAQRLVHLLDASQVSDILQALATLQQRQAVPLVLRLSRRASRVLGAFSDDEVIKVLSALRTLGHHDEELLYALEKHLPGRLGKCDPELIAAVTEYCLRMKCRSEPILEAVAENFVRRAEGHAPLQIAKQVAAMGGLNYLPQRSREMFRTLEGVLSARWAQFQPRALVQVLHACVQLERFPLNHVSRVFSPYFLQRLQAQGEPLDRTALGQLTQLHLSTSLECSHYWGPRLPYFLHVKRFSSVDQAFETPMEGLLYKQVKGPLAELLGGSFYSARVFTHTGYTIDVELCLDDEGYILPPSQWELTHRRVALCLDGEKRFCSNTQHLLGKEATKRRHLRRMGYEVVQIPYFEFERLITQEEQVQYLHNKIFPTVLRSSR